MKLYHRNENLIWHENPVWLRYMLWAAAIGMLVLAVGAFNAPARDIEKIIESTLGVVLLGFCGFVLPSRTIVVDPTHRIVTIASRRFRRESTERMRFEDIRKVLVLATFESVENVRGAEVLRERWYIAFALAGRTVPVNRNLYVTKEGALRDAKQIQQLLRVELCESAEESIAYLAQNGRKFEARTLASRALGLSMVQAEELVNRIAGSN